MEQLKPILKHKFWIIAGAVLLVTFVGWWIGTSAKAAYIEQRWAALSGLKVAQGTNTPNQDYLNEIDKVIQVLDQNQDVLDNRLYEKQKSLHTWPENVANFMDGKQFRDPASRDALLIYAREHYDEFRNMLNDLPRYRWDENTLAEYGIVYIEKDLDIPHVPPVDWKDTTPTSDAMWDIQEDIWLTRSILAAIKKVNEDAGATKISDAPIKWIVSLKFRGGSREVAGAAGGTEGGDAMSGGGYGGGYNNYGDQDMGGQGDYDQGNYGSGQMGQGGGDFALNKTLKIDLDSVFGPETIQAAAAGDGEMSSMSGGGNQYGAEARRRYVDDDPALPYRTRGFFIELKMQHDKLPELQAALLNMPWPTELLLIQQASEQEDIIKPVFEETKQGGPPRTRFNQRQPGFGAPNAFGPNRGFGPGANRFGPQNQFGGRQPGFSSGPRFAPPGARQGFTPMGRSGMGNMGNMGNMMNQNYGESGGEYQADTSAFGKAMSDPYLAKVGIAGLMTIYRSPQEMAKSKGEEAKPVIQSELPIPTEVQPAEGQPAEGQPVPPGTPPVDPNAPVPTEPMPGQPAPEARKTETNPAQPLPAEPSNPAVPPAKETPAPTPESPAPMKSETEEQKPAKDESTPEKTPPPENPETPKS